MKTLTLQKTSSGTWMGIKSLFTRIINKTKAILVQWPESWQTYSTCHKSVLMLPKKLQWTYIGRNGVDWLGNLSDGIPPICFALEKLGDNNYVIIANVEGIPKKPCRDLEQAKIEAQKLFNAYVLCLLEVYGKEKRSTQILLIK